MLGLIIWCILIIIIAACLLPWWFLPAMATIGVLYELIKK